VSFSVPEQHLNSLLRSKESDDLIVSIETSSGQKIKDGKIIFIDNNIDIASGTIKLKALMPNENEILWPGQLVKVFLNVYNKKNALVIPTKAIQINQNGSFVFVINQNNKVSIRNIKIEFSDDNYAVVTKGLSIGETIVINGQLRLSQDKLVIPTLIEGKL
jgi:multidrug efflux system membrane fusion protein